MTVTTIGGSLTNGVVLHQGNYGSSLAIAPAGKITGGIYAVYASRNATNVTIVNNGVLHAGAFAVAILGGGTIQNAGTISGGGEGVYLPTGRFSTLTNAGHIYGSIAGAAMLGGYMTNAGTVTGDRSAVLVAGGLLTNTQTGDVAGTEFGVVLRPGTVAGAGGVNNADFRNNGIVSGGTVGVYLSDTTFGGGILLTAGLTNAGTIDKSQVGVAGQSGAVTNTGLISGTTSGVALQTGVLTNSGTIAGPNYAVYGYNALQLYLLPGSVFKGKVEDGLNNGGITLGGTAVATLSGLGTSIVGFDYIRSASQSSWSLQGNVAGLASGQEIVDMPAGGIVLDDFAATYGRYVNGTGITLTNGASIETLSVSGDVNYQYTSVYTEHGNTYIKNIPTAQLNGVSLRPGLVSTITAGVGIEVTPGEGNYALGVTITTAGGVVTSTAPAIYAPKFVSNASVFNGGQIGVAGQASAVQFANAGTLLNVGTITATGGSNGVSGGDAVNMKAGGLLRNDGVIYGGAYGRSLNVTNAGTIENSRRYGDGLVVYGGSILNSGDIVGEYIGLQPEGVVGITDSGTISGGTDALISFDSINLTIDPGAAFRGAVVDVLGSAQMTFAGTTAGVLNMGTSFSGFQDINFAAGAIWTLEGAKNEFAAGQTIAGFAGGDTLVLDSFAVNSLDTTYAAGTGLALTDTLGNHVTLDIAGDFSTNNFIVTDDAEETLIELAVCYLRGTRLLTPAGEIAVESLSIGDAVITKFGGYRAIKWIGRQSYARPFIRKNFDQIPVRITAGALGENLPKRDLWISPGHSMLIGGVLVLAKSLINGITITQGYCPEAVDYFQLEFETHDCVLAEGAWSESYADTPELRNKFHNVHEFHALYPSHVEPAVQTLCAERPLDGPALGEALQPITGRAQAGRAPGTLHGFVDQITAAGLIRGWAWDERNCELPVLLEILVRGRLIGTVLACDHRIDLQAAGLGRGRCAFSFISPIGLPGSGTRDVQVRRAADGMLLRWSAECIAAAGADRAHRKAA